MNLVDFQIVSTAAVAFLVFVACQILVFRRIDHRMAVVWFIRILASVGILLFTANALYGSLFAGFFAFILYMVASCAYFMGVFGLLATSVRIRLLCEVAAAGEQGVTWDQLLRKYNKRMIIKKRLERFVASGEVVLRDRKYYIKEGLTFFRLPTILLSLMKTICGVSISK